MSNLVTFPLNSNEKVEDLLLDQGFSHIESCCSGGGEEDLLLELVCSEQRKAGWHPIPVKRKLNATGC